MSKSNDTHSLSPATADKWTAIDMQHHTIRACRLYILVIKSG